MVYLRIIDTFLKKKKTALKLYEGAIHHRIIVSAVRRANAIPTIFFSNFVMYPTGEFKVCFPFVGMTLACIFTLTRNALIVFRGILLKICNFFFFFFFYDRTVSAMSLKIWFYHIDIIICHCNFLQVDLSTHESPLGPLSQAETRKLEGKDQHVVIYQCQHF